ncbi:hypothetical protein ASE01_03485 [Nocardioides sp. Root190]|nr:hypothetical protein ASE01_03485 [Nocardioides sp. Root190]
MAGGFLATPSSQAWDNDPNVTVQGGGGCQKLFFKATSVSFALDNGETATSAFSGRSYKVNFTNISGAPLNGNAGYALVECTNVLNPAQKYYWQRGVSVQRPRFGKIQTFNLGGG